MKRYRIYLTLVAVAILIASTGTTTLYSQKIIPCGDKSTTLVVSPGSLNDWQQQHANCSGGTSTGSQTFVFGPQAPPRGAGSLRFTIGANGDSSETVSYPNIDGVRVDGLTALSYSTFVTNFNDGEAPYILLNIDFNGDSTLDDQIFFEPVYQSATFFPPNPQGPPVEGTWQTWDALSGGWWSLNTICGAGPGANVKSIAQYLSCQPDARIINSGGLGGLRVATGCGGAGWAGFDGNLDNLTIGIAGNCTTFDFEAENPPCVVAPANMVSWWPADGNTNDIQGSNDGMLQGTATFDTGKVGQAFSFDGGGFVSVADSASLQLPDTPFTIDLWLNTNTTATSQMILSKGVSNANEEYSINLQPDGSIFWKYGGAQSFVITNPGIISANQWYHLAVVYDPALSPRGSVYLNGAAQGISASGAGAHIPSSGSDFYIGTQNAGAPYYAGRISFNGLVDEVEIFSRALTLEEIQSLFNAGSSGKCKCPGITCPDNISLQNDPGQCGAVVNYPSPGGDASCVVTCTPPSGSFFPTNSTLVTCTAASGPNCTFTVIVNDTEPPSLTCPQNITQSSAQCSAVVKYPNPTVTDNCSCGSNGKGAPQGDQCQPSCSPASGSTFAVGTTTVTCTATDASGNQGSCTFTVTLQDTQPPTITCPANITQPEDPNQCSTEVSYSPPSVSDECPGVGTPVCNPASGSTFLKGITTVTCTVSDAGGNQASCTFTVTVTDTQPPTITCPESVTRATDPNQCGAVVTYPGPTANDNCPDLTVVCSPASGSFFPKGVTTVTCTATDTSGNTATCTFTVTVNDTQPPAITCPPNQPQGNDPNQCGAVVNYPAPIVTDNCPNVGTPICLPASGSFFPVGTSTVSCTVSDASSNTAGCAFTVTVNDTQPPQITCPANITALIDQSTCPNLECRTVTYATPVATDNCAAVNVVCNPPSGSCFPTGVTSVICTATDTSGNTATCSFTVTTFDTALQDDSNPNTILLWNSVTGQYRFCCNGVTYTGVGKATRQGCVYTLQHNPADRRVLGRADKAAHSGTGSIQAPAGTTRCTITDRDTLNDTNLASCQ